MADLLRLGRQTDAEEMMLGQLKWVLYQLAHKHTEPLFVSTYDYSTTTGL
jgi:hypothetical protein